MAPWRTNLADLRSFIGERIFQVPFDTIIDAIRSHAPTCEYYLFVRHRKLFDENARHQIGDFLIFPYFSFFVSDTFLYRLHALEYPHQLTVLDMDFSSYWSTSTPYVIVFGRHEDSEYLTLLRDLIHQHFIFSELDTIVDRAAFRLMQSGAVNQLYDNLITLNKERFGLRSLFCTILPDGRLNPTLTNLDPSALLAYHGISAMSGLCKTYRQSVSRELTDENTRLFAKAIPVKQGTRLRIVGIFFLVSYDHPIDGFAAKLNEIFIDRTNDSQISTAKDAVEKEIQDRIIRASGSRHSDTFGETRDFCSFVLSRLGQSTGSHSATIRRYNSYSNSLDLVSYWSLDDNVEPPSLSIPVDHTSSVNSYCYLNAKDREMVYIRDIANIPDEYRDFGLRSTLVKRRDTKSEICLPIGLNPIRFGTLNLESPLYAAYELDIEFLRSAAFHVAEFWKTINSAGDTWWLSQLSLTHLATHELRDFKETLDPERQRSLENILYTISPTDQYSESRTLTWQSFLDFVHSAHNRLAPTERFADIWKIHGIHPDRGLSPRFLSSLRLIVLSILSNTKHSDYSHNRIFVRSISTPSGGAVMEITYDSCVNYIDPDTLREIEERFRVPALSGDGWHFGLFLLGVHARLLGGDIEILPDCKREYDYAPFSYRVRVPLEEIQSDNRLDHRR